MNKKPLAYFLCVVTLLLIAISPLLITSFFSEPVQKDSFEGILEFWHISDWDTAGSSKAAFLAKRIKEFENKNPHVFIRMTKMTSAQALGEINKGILPDIISYPGSFPHQFNSQSPYMYGAYYIIVNDEISDENGILLPDGFGLSSDMFNDLCKFGLVFDAEEGYSALPSIALQETPGPPSPDITTWPKDGDTDIALDLSPSAYFDGLEPFLEGKACVMIASQHQFFQAQTSYEQNEGPAFSVYVVSGYTDMVQYISTLPNEDTLRRQMSSDFAQYLVSERVQRKLSALGVFPVIESVKIYEDDEINTKIYELLMKKPAIVSPENQETLTDLALRSFSGDRSALKQLRNLLE